MGVLILVKWNVEESCKQLVGLHVHKEQRGSLSQDHLLTLIDDLEHERVNAGDITADGAHKGGEKLIQDLVLICLTNLQQCIF